MLIEKGHRVISSDLHDWGYGETGKDFLSTLRRPLSGMGKNFNIDKVDLVHLITNPPFKLANEFIQHCVTLDIPKFALLLKLTALAGQKRSVLLEQTRLSRVWVFRNRLTMTGLGQPMKNSGMMDFAWFVWDKSCSGWESPVLNWVTAIKDEKKDQPTLF